MTYAPTVSTRVHEAVSKFRRNPIALFGTLAISILIVGVINQSILFRSPWGDEASLLRNLKVIGWSGAFFQLPLFDLASPPGATLSLKALAELTQYNCAAMRLGLLLANFLFMYWATRATKIVNKEVPFVLFWLCSPLVYYTTELKHYSFELIASYIMIVTIATTQSRGKLHLANVSALLLSFGAIIQVATQMIMRGFAWLEEWRQDRRQAIGRRVVDLAITLTILLAFIVYGKYLTEVQLANFSDQSYKNNGLIIDVLRLCKVFVLAYGIPLLLIGVVVIITAVRVFGIRAVAYDRLTIFLLLCILLVATLRLLGFYPAVYPRHIIWIVPPSIFVISIWLDRILIISRVKVLRAVSLVGMVVAAVAMSRTPMEQSSDDGLFFALAKLPPASDVVLNLGAQVALPLYEDKDPSLSQYVYHGWVNPITASTLPEEVAMKDFASNASQPGAFSTWTYFVLNHDFRPLWSYLLGTETASKFYIATSWQTPIESPVLDDSAKAMLELLKERGCSYDSIYSGKFVEILSVRCGA